MLEEELVQQGIPVRDSLIMCLCVTLLGAKSVKIDRL